MSIPNDQAKPEPGDPDSGDSLLHVLARGGVLSPAGTGSAARVLRENAYYEPVSVLGEAVRDGRFSTPDVEVIALHALALYREPDPPWASLDAVLQTILKHLEEAGSAPLPLIEEAVRTVAVEYGGTKVYLLGQYLQSTGSQNPAYRSLVVAHLNQANYSALSRSFSPPETNPVPIHDMTEWEYQGWLPFAREWALADLFFALDTEREQIALLAQPIPQGMPVPEMVHYFLLHRYWLGTLTPNLLREVGRLVRRAGDVPNGRVLQDRAVLVFHRQWGNVIPYGIGAMAAEVYLALQRRHQQLAPGQPPPEMPGMDLNHLAQLTAPPPPPPAAPAREPDLLPSERERQRKINRLQATVTYNPDDVSSWHELADLHRENRNWDLAVEAETEAIRRHPQYVIAYYGRAKAHMARQDYAAALTDFATAIRVWEFPHGLERYLTIEKPPEELIDAYRTRGVASAHLGDYAAALVDLATALRLNPDSARLHFERAWLAEKGRFTPEAIQEYYQAARLYADRNLKADLDSCLEALDRLGAVAEAREIRTWLDSRRPPSDLPL